MNLDLTPDEIQGLLMLMAKTPTESGFYPLMMKVNAQFQEQLPKIEPKTEPEA